MTMKIARLEHVSGSTNSPDATSGPHPDPNDGLIGLGETFYVHAAISAMVHDVFAGLLLGRSALGHREPLGRTCSMRSDSLATGAARRAP
jgi:hypothetical protein